METKVHFFAVALQKLLDGEFPVGFQMYRDATGTLVLDWPDLSVDSIDNLQECPGTRQSCAPFMEWPEVPVDVAGVVLFLNDGTPLVFFAAAAEAEKGHGIILRNPGDLKVSDV